MTASLRTDEMRWFSFSLAWRTSKSVDNEAELGSSWQSPVEVVRRGEKSKTQIEDLSDELLVRILAALDVRDLIR